MNTKYAEWEKAYPEKSQRLESLEARIVKIQEEKARHEAVIASLKLQIKARDAARDAALGTKADGSPLSGGSNKRRKTKRKLSRKRKLSKKRKSKKRKSKKKNKTRRHR